MKKVHQEVGMGASVANATDGSIARSNVQFTGDGSKRCFRKHVRGKRYTFENADWPVSSRNLYQTP